MDAIRSPKNDQYLEYPGNLGGLLDISKELFPERAGIGTSDGMLTFEEYHERVCRTVHGLRRIGVNPGDRVLLASSNSLYYALISLAVFRIGAVLIPVNPRMRHIELDHILTDALPGYAVCESAVMERVMRVYENRSRMQPPHFVSLDQRVSSCTFVGDLDQGLSSPQYEAMPDHETAMVVYTAGMDGYSLGAELTHGSLFHDALSFAEASILPMEDDEKVVASALPLFHCYGFTNGILVPLAGSATCLLLKTSMRRRNLIKILKDFHARQLISVPAVFLSLFKPLAEDPEFRSLLINLTSGGIAIPLKLLRSYEKDLGIRIREGYGLTETSPVVTWNSPERPAKFGTVGRPLSCCEVKITDGSGKILPPGKEGEVEVKGLNLFSGYLNRPDYTNKVYVNGWFKTGDLGYLDDENFLTITGLKKDMINIMGLKVYPKEVERILSFNPDIESVRVWGDWDPKYGNIVACEIRPKAGRSVTENAFHKWCKENISPYKIPRKIIISG